MAFILNHQEHWFSLRRFGSLADPDNGHWFNLNSFLSEPEWVGKLYLGMVLSQAEDEGGEKSPNCNHTLILYYGRLLCFCRLTAP
jgi:hypothetical protein